MNDEQLRQRINYLVEHGGLWQDPMADINKAVRINRIIAGLALVLMVIDVAYTLA